MKIKQTAQSDGRFVKVIEVGVGACVIIFGGISFYSVYRAFGSADSYSHDHDQHLYRQVERFADTNRDGATSQDEWRRVYEELGVEFNPLSPVKLSASNLETYLAKHKNDF